MSDADDPYPINHEMDPTFLALGRVASAWSSLEYMIQRGIWEIANVEQHVGACITAQIVPPSGKCRAYIALIALQQPPKPLIGKLNRFASRVDAKARMRNRYIHDPWTYNTTKNWPARLEVTADKQLKYGPVQTEPKELEEFRRQVCELIHHFQLLHAEVLAALPPSPRRRYAQSAGIALVPLNPDN